jgi:hypothetical protein
MESILVQSSTGLAVSQHILFRKHITNLLIYVIPAARSTAWLVVTERPGSEWMVCSTLLGYFGVLDTEKTGVDLISDGDRDQPVRSDLEFLERNVYVLGQECSIPSTYCQKVGITWNSEESSGLRYEQTSLGERQTQIILKAK